MIKKTIILILVIGLAVGAFMAYNMYQKVYQPNVTLENTNDKYFYIFSNYEFNDVVHDIPSQFILEHPGGPNMIKSRIGKDITHVFNGHIYNHSNAARNVLSHYRVAKIYKQLKRMQRAMGIIYVA